MKPVKTKAAVWTYQQLNGNNLTLAGVEAATKIGKESMSIYTGACTSYTPGTTGGFIDFKASAPLNDSGLYFGVRYRNIFTPNAQTGEVRGQLNIDIPLTENLEAYGTAYGRVKMNYQTGARSTTEGIFTGLWYFQS